MATCTHPGMKRLFCLKAKNGLIVITVARTSEVEYRNIDVMEEERILPVAACLMQKDFNHCY